MVRELDPGSKARLSQRNDARAELGINQVVLREKRMPSWEVPGSPCTDPMKDATIKAG